MSVIQLDLSRQKFYMSPDDPLPKFYPPPRVIQVTPIYDSTPPSDSEYPGVNQKPSSTHPSHHDHTSGNRNHDDDDEEDEPTINKIPEQIDSIDSIDPSKPHPIQPSSSRHDDHHHLPSASYSPSRDQRYDDPNPSSHYYPEHQRDDHYYSGDHRSRRRRRPYYDDDNDNDSSDSDDHADSRSGDNNNNNNDYSFDFDPPSSDYDRSPSDSDRPPLDNNDPHSSPQHHDHHQNVSQSNRTAHHEQSSSSQPNRSAAHHHDQRPSSSHPNRSAAHHDQRPSSSHPNRTAAQHDPGERLNQIATNAVSVLQNYLEHNRLAAHRDPFAHLKKFPEEVQRVLKAIPPSSQFCWSECVGERKAVCVGINYVGQKNQLKGCANDARHMRSFLMKYHQFKSENIYLLADDGQPVSMKPTRKNMFDAMKWLVKDAKANDSLFFHYSGHGGQVKDETGKECDGMDEVIFPVDFQSTSHIADNDLFTALVSPLPTGCRLTAVFDSCHSGTVLDLPYLHSAHGRLRSIAHITQRARQRGVAPSADVICFAGCKDDETSADTFVGGVAVGAMSYALLKILKGIAVNQTHLTYCQILQQLRAILVPKYSQKPQISGTHPVDLDRDFTL